MRRVMKTCFSFMLLRVEGSNRSAVQLLLVHEAHESGTIGGRRLNSRDTFLEPVEARSYRESQEVLTFSADLAERVTVHRGNAVAVQQEHLQHRGWSGACASLSRKRVI